MTFSIITVTYNAAQWIERTVQSILSQTYPHIEYIIVDGCSTDGTIDIIRNNPQLSTFNFQFLSEPDKGLYDAMNKGLKLATGDYVWFINAGDTLHSADTVEEITDLLKKMLSLPDVVYGETIIVDSQGILMYPRRLKTPEILTWKSFRMGMLVCHQSFIVKKGIAPLYNLDYSLSADFDWCVRCLKQAKATYNTHRVLSDFMEDGMSTRQRKKSLKERYKIMCKYYGWLSTSLLHLWFAVRFYTAKWITGKV